MKRRTVLVKTGKPYRERVPATTEQLFSLDDFIRIAYLADTPKAREIQETWNAIIEEKAPGRKLTESERIEIIKSAATSVPATFKEQAIYRRKGLLPKTRL